MFTTRYYEPANLAATIIQATTVTQLHSLYWHNRTLFEANADLYNRLTEKHKQLTITTHAPCGSEGAE